MKSLYMSIACSLLMLTGCFTDEPQPTKPNNITQGNGKGILYGITNQWVFMHGYSNSSWDTRQSGVKVEIVNTTISTETDGYGEYKFTGIDSGMYSIRFSKKGYDTVVIDSVRSNGRDSVQIIFTLYDSIGHKMEYQEVFLRELSPIVSVTKATANATETIRTDTVFDHGTIREIRRDTSYSWQGEFSIDLKSDVKATQDSLHVGYYAAITNSSTVDKTLIPTEFSDALPEVKKGWIPYYGSSLRTKPIYTGTRDFVLNSSGSNADMQVLLGSTIMSLKVSRQQQLYLHIIPITVKKILLQKSNRFSTWLEFGGGYHLGEIKSIPIQWK